MKINKKMIPNPASSQVRDIPLCTRDNTEVKLSSFNQSSGQVHEAEGNPVGDAILSQSKPRFLNTRDIQNTSILFVDARITFETTTSLCYEALVRIGNHADVLIWMSSGG